MQTVARRKGPQATAGTWVTRLGPNKNSHRRLSSSVEKQPNIFDPDEHIYILRFLFDMSADGVVCRSRPASALPRGQFNEV